MMEVLRTAAGLQLPDWWIGAGFVRAKVWDHLHGYDARTPLEDVDVLYFQPEDLSRQAEEAAERQLFELRPDIPWSVKNQARMHLRNGDAPYRSTCHAMAFWAETPTAVAVALQRGRIAVIAPHGTADLMRLVVRPTPRFRHKLRIFRARVAKKRWSDRWPRLTVLDRPVYPVASPSSIDLRPRKAGVGWVTR